MFPTLRLQSAYYLLKNEVKTSSTIVGLVLKDVKEGHSTIPLNVKPILEEFQDLTPKQAKLPHKRDIHHNIDLVPMASLLSLQYFRMSPSEHEVIQGIVDDLLNKLI